MLDGIGLEELLLVGLLGLVMFSPSELAKAVRTVRVWKATLQSWIEGMWRGL